MRNPAKDLRHPLKKRVTRLRDELGDVVDPECKTGIIEAVIEHVPMIVISAMDMAQLLASRLLDCPCLRRGAVLTDEAGHIIVTAETLIERCCESCKASMYEIQRLSELINNPLTDAKLAELYNERQKARKTAREVAAQEDLSKDEGSSKGILEVTDGEEDG